MEITQHENHNDQSSCLDPSMIFDHLFTFYHHPCRSPTLTVQPVDCFEAVQISTIVPVLPSQTNANPISKNIQSFVRKSKVMHSNRRFSNKQKLKKTR